MFAWAPIPEPFRTLGSVEFSTLLVEKAEVAVSPGIGFGEHGEGYVRIALVENEQRIRQAARNVRRFLETGAGKAAQRRSACHAALVERRRSAGWRRFMAEPLKVGLAGLGTVGAVGRPPDRAAARRRLPARCGRADRAGRRDARARAARSATSTCRHMRWVDDPVALARDPAIDVFVELIGGDGDPAKSAVEAALDAGKPVVTANKALLARHGVALAALAEKQQRRAQFRGGGRRRHPDRQDAARRPRRQSVHARLRHPQRHLQLHPHAHGAGAAVLRRLPEGGAAARLCRGRSDLRHRRLRHRAQARDPDEPRLRHRGRSRARSTSKASPRSRPPTSRPPTSSATASSCSASRCAPTAASSSACIRPWCRGIRRSPRSWA